MSRGVVARRKDVMDPEDPRFDFYNSELSVLTDTDLYPLSIFDYGEEPYSRTPAESNVLDMDVWDLETPGYVVSRVPHGIYGDWDRKQYSQ